MFEDEYFFKKWMIILDNDNSNNDTEDNVDDNALEGKEHILNY